MEFTKHYLTYENYTTLGGTLTETPFNVLELKAQKAIDKYTFGRLQDLEEQINEVKVCAFELINKLENYQSADKNNGISSESTDGYSVSYGAKTSDSVSSMEKDIENCIKTYLSECKLEDGTPYLYCGVV